MTRQVPWLRVFVEGVVIVASILLALGLDAWWDGVQERQEEREALELILADLVADTTEIRQAFTSAARYEREATWLSDRWDALDVHPDSVGQAVRAFIPLSTNQFRSAAFNSLKDGNQLSLIENDSLRSAMVS